jgi:hypothetical protein
MLAKIKYFPFFQPSTTCAPKPLRSYVVQVNSLAINANVFWRLKRFDQN